MRTHKILFAALLHAFQLCVAEPECAFPVKAAVSYAVG